VKIHPESNSATIYPIFASIMLINLARQVESSGNSKHVSNPSIGEKAENLQRKNNSENFNFLSIQPFAQTLRKLFEFDKMSTDKLPPHHLRFGNRVGKSTSIEGDIFSVYSQLKGSTILAES
jgi:hypothetical protein